MVTYYFICFFFSVNNGENRHGLPSGDEEPHAEEEGEGAGHAGDHGRQDVRVEVEWRVAPVHHHHHGLRREGGCITETEDCFSLSFEIRYILYGNKSRPSTKSNMTGPQLVTVQAE